jgi:polysaccharide export outer membrane protein
MTLRSAALVLLLAPVVASAQQSVTRPAIATPAPPPAPAEAAPATPALVAPPTDASRYIIAPEDNLQITVWKEPSISGTLPVRPDGMISLALVGDLQASGLTPMQLSAAIAERLKKFIQDPNVTVTLLGVHAKQIFLLGEIIHVGSFPLIPGMTPLQAISTAGGLTPFANPKKIYILRGEQGKQQKIPFNYKKAVKEGNLQGIALQPGDTIVVP